MVSYVKQGQGVKRELSADGRKQDKGGSNGFLNKGK